MLLVEQQKYEQFKLCKNTTKHTAFTAPQLAVSWSLPYHELRYSQTPSAETISNGLQQKYVMTSYYQKFHMVHATVTLTTANIWSIFAKLLNYEAFTYWLLLKVLSPTQHNTRHFRYSPSQSFGMEKTKPNTTGAHIHQSKHMHNNTK